MIQVAKKILREREKENKKKKEKAKEHGMVFRTRTLGQ
jgi:hypothetical protein